MDPEVGQSPQIEFPDFMDYQDYVNPVFRLDLFLPQEVTSSLEDSPASPSTDH